MINQKDCEEVTIRPRRGEKKKRILREWNLDEQQDDEYEDEQQKDDYEDAHDDADS